MKAMHEGRWQKGGDRESVTVSVTVSVWGQEGAEWRGLVMVT